MATVNNRPFPCADNAFIESVLEDHKKSINEHSSMVFAFSGGSNPSPFVFTYNEHIIPTDCNAYYVKITFDPKVSSNEDITVQFEAWPDDAGKPISRSGEVYYSLAFFNGIRNRKYAFYLEFRKAIERTDWGEYVTVVVEGFRYDGTSVYLGNLTSAFPHDIG